VTANHAAFTAIVDGSTGSLHAARTMNVVDQVFGTNRLQLREAVNAAKPGLAKVFGADQAHMSGLLHADLGGVSSARAILGSAAPDSARALEAARGGARSSESLINAIDGAIPSLESAAAHRSTMFKVGAVGVGIAAAVGGALLLRHLVQSHDDGDGGRIMAPGPLRGVPGFDPAVDPTGVVI
jgi:hypothetical protein